MERRAQALAGRPRAGTGAGRGTPPNAPHAPMWVAVLVMGFLHGETIALQEQKLTNSDPVRKAVDQHRI